MSRRIAISALAACATLISTAAFADRECFEASCRADEARMPEVTEPAPVFLPEPTEPAAAVPTEAPGSDAVPPAMVDRQDSSAPGAPRAQAAKPVPPRPDRFETTRMPDRVTRDAPRYVEEQGPIRVAHQNYTVRSNQGPAYVVNQGAHQGSAVVVVVAPGVYEDGVTPAYPHLRPDPTWKPCQIDQRRGQYTYCGPYSYYPYGSNGYRPLGTYQAYRAAPSYIAPDARIISIESND